MNHTAKFLFILFLFSTCSIVNAQERVQKRVNPVHKGQLGFGIKGGGIVGYTGGAFPLMGLFANYTLSDRIRLEAEYDLVVFACERGGLNANYLFPVHPRLTLYPILGGGYCTGVTSSDPRLARRFHVYELVLGGGCQYHLGRHFALALEAKMPMIPLVWGSYVTLQMQFSFDLLGTIRSIAN